jgi:hypothetical protein
VRRRLSSTCQKTEIVMDVFSASAFVAARHADLVREADESRLARAARESRDEPKPAPRPVPRAVRARRLGVAR